MSNSEKNLNSLNLSEVIRYIPAVLHEQKGKDWRIVYYALHPQSHELQKVRIRVNLIKKKYPKKSDARRHCAEMIQQINAKLSGGWSPFFEGEDSRLYVPLTEVCRLFVAERELRTATMRSYQSFCKMLCEWADKNAPKIYCSLFNHNYAIRYMDYVYSHKKVSAVTYNNTRKMGIAMYNWAIEHCYTKQNAFQTYAFDFGSFSKSSGVRASVFTLSIITTSNFETSAGNLSFKIRFGLLILRRTIFSWSV